MTSTSHIVKRKSYNDNQKSNPFTIRQFLPCNANLMGNRQPNHSQSTLLSISNLYKHQLIRNTDGSLRVGRSGAGVYNDRGSACKTYVLGKYSSVLQAELAAGATDPNNQISICSADTQAALTTCRQARVSLPMPGTELKNSRNRAKSTKTRIFFTYIN